MYNIWNPATSIFNINVVTEQEECLGKELNINQRNYLHNLRAEKAEMLLRLPFTPADVVGYAQHEAYLTGQLELLDTLLLPSNTPDETTGD